MYDDNIKMVLVCSERNLKNFIKPRKCVKDKNKISKKKLGFFFFKLNAAGQADKKYMKN